MALTKNWIIGFIEGEGSFTYCTNYNLKGKRLLPEFELAQKNTKILSEVAEYIGVTPHIYTKGRSCPALRITMFSDIKKIQSFCDGSLKTDAKRKQFKRWCKIIRNKENGYFISIENLSDNEKRKCISYNERLKRWRMKKRGERQ